MVTGSLFLQISLLTPNIGISGKHTIYFKVGGIYIYIYIYIYIRKYIYIYTWVYVVQAIYIPIWNCLLVDFFHHIVSYITLMNNSVIPIMCSMKAMHNYRVEPKVTSRVQQISLILSVFLQVRIRYRRILLWPRRLE